MPLNVAQLDVLAAVSDAGSISAAARRLGVSQPGVSKQVRALERAVGHELIVRHGRGVEMTEIGRVLAEHAKRISAIVQAAERAIEDASALRVGRLTVGATPTLGSYVLPPVIVRFRERFPGVALRVETQSAEVLYERVSDGVLDVGLTQAAVDGPGVCTAAVGRECLVVVAAPSHPLARRRSVDGTALAGQSFVFREGPDGRPAWAARMLARHHIGVRTALTVGSTAAVKHAAGAGAGLAVVSQSAVRDELESGRLVTVHVRGLDLSRPVYKVTRSDRRETRATLEFVSLVRGALGRPPRRRAGSS